MVKHVFLAQVFIALLRVVQSWTLGFEVSGSTHEIDGWSTQTYVAALEDRYGFRG